MAVEATVFVAAGSNLGDSLSYLKFGIESLHTASGCRVSRVSPWYRSTAIGPGRQNDYINGVIELSTTREPLPLLDLLQEVEAAAGRERGIRWGARTLDLDMLLYPGIEASNARLTLPHPRLMARNFVVYPLYDLAPALILPGDTPLARLRSELSDQGICRLEAEPGISFG
ncbi:MAG: 2-amino-4-hydroxy-6-hydroxymethyldihydropteridine diphosphokinase [Gammaproteobacteria bacterium]|jgi:2-amino-4-hydroxy-6-hydroxymethyldihydropteridine diphosphokinase|nr:2-amino-4-hydroxy-6-hydroxymethyldihydropteridine diphosphokinase [Gammaproteobacteria bacterium]MBP6053592.1 2-amino-4-hydroxy-6-hydroxymethyldihydropteridine diphosphokinase [Pseudomonadales bacterium]MBK6581391.1 2-amino-4-hydroxy-6-hydroxymethyldihydropteridine diphosphokinase [Gammaproteobacteria bacterium]MBK7518659.1 2-amino-4-hydroxy-6-hydroxymethyldihydropteridine diphosphokinase [Gammaproteobacteria bacterium]MBK7727051.1 2-amino-4-hydroxy-6-hydroxymethyldihydropteridine diphosphok